MPGPLINVGRRLSETARRDPRGIAVVETFPAQSTEKPRRYETRTFGELDEDTDRIAAGLFRMGIPRGTRLALLVRPGIDFIALVFAMLKAGVVMVLVDPGMGRRAAVHCLGEAQVAGFVAIPLAHAIRCLLRRKFASARFNVTVGRRWLWGGTTLEQLRQTPPHDGLAIPTHADDPAAIIFTSGSTGPPKGVLYCHGNFNRQVDEIRDQYAIQPGEIDVAGFPLFALFNAAMGVTTVFPHMDFSRPASVDPHEFLAAVNDWQATQAFGSPALWNVVGRHCEQHSARMPTLRRALSAGAPVPPHVLRRVKLAMHSEGEMYTPYGATEALPVASISASEVLQTTAALSQAGKGTCVGRRFPGIDWRIIQITDDPIPLLEDAIVVPQGEIGELIVRGPVVTRSYATCPAANAVHKIVDVVNNTFWHRLGDVGYLDDQDRFWFCGRKSHRVRTAQGTMFTIPCEAIFNQDERIYRSALVGVGSPGTQEPVVIVEPWPERRPRDAEAKRQLIADLLCRAAEHPLTRSIRRLFVVDALPVDTRHNSKIFREQLAVSAAKWLGKSGEGR